MAPAVWGLAGMPGPSRIRWQIAHLSAEIPNQSNIINYLFRPCEEAEESRQRKYTAPMQRSLPQCEVVGSDWSGCPILHGRGGPDWSPQNCPLSLGEEGEGGQPHLPSPSLGWWWWWGVMWAGLRTFLNGLFSK